MLKPARKLPNDLWRVFPHTYAERMSAWKWKPYAYCREISLAITEAFARGGGLILVSLPPRHGKSEFISFWTPTWFIDENPEKFVLLASYEAGFAASWGRRVRNEIINNAEHRARLASDSTAADRWHTTAGGGMITAGVNGAILGRGGHLNIIDDPTKNWQEATSPTFQEHTINWFKTTFWTRREPGAVVVVLMQRWTPNDLYGWIKSNLGELKLDVPITELCFSALAEENDRLGRAEGEALCPDRYPKDVLEAIKVLQGSHQFAALYQQRPSPLEGGIIKREWLKFYKVLPAELDDTIQSWDLAVKNTIHSDFCAGQVWSRKGSSCYLVDRVKVRADFPAQVQLIRQMTAKHPNAYLKLIEAKANGPAVMATLEQEIFGIVPYDPDKNKEARLNAVAPLFEAGNVHLPDPTIAPWVGDFIEELCSFPNAPHDDEVDACSQALIRFQVGGSSQLERLLSW